MNDYVNLLDITEEEYNLFCNVSMEMVKRFIPNPASTEDV